MKIETIQEGEGLRIVFHGNIDLASVDDVRSELMGIGERNSPKYFLDFQKVDFVDSAGLGALVTFHRAQGGSEIVFQNVNERVRKLFQITRLDSVFSVE
ncbi:MAG: STAS domain-containing protein [Deltaproteobacteria bacterium]|nr:STAS domain-containing protein [Deltaproteobacteria bacterium]